MDEKPPETESGPANNETEVVANAAETQQEWRAWSSAETGSQPVADYIPEPRWRRLLPIVLGFAAAAAIGTVVAVVILTPDHSQPSKPSPTNTADNGSASQAPAPAHLPTQAAPPPEPPPSAVRCGPAGCTPSPVAPTTAAALNGIYRFDYPASGSGLDAIGPSSVWWKFSSECAKDGCTALGQAVTGSDHRTLVAGVVEIYTFSGGMWHLQASPPNPNDDAPNIPDPVPGCAGDGQSLAPQPDGSFLGINTAIVQPCGSANTKVTTFQVVKRSS
jgi:hypothetical protein